MNSPTATPANRARAAAGIPSTELSVIEQKTEQRIAVVRSMLPAFRDALRTEPDAKRLIRDAITALRTVPKLTECTQESFLGALMTAAQLDLRPNVATLGHGWVLPYENRKRGTVEAQWILGYRGMITLAGRSGVSVVGRTIYSNEDHEIRYGIDERLHHVPIFDKDKRGHPLMHYAIARGATGMAWLVIGDDEARDTRDASPGYKFGGPDNPWRKWYGPMARKTAVRRLFAFVPTDSPELAMGIASDETVRTDLSPDALEQFDGSPEPTTYTSVERVDEPTTVEPDESKAKPKRRPAAATTPKAADAAGDDSAPPRRKPAQSALWKGLRKRAEEVHGNALDHAIKRATGNVIPADYLTTDELHAVIKFDADADADAQADAAFAADQLKDQSSE